MISPPRRDTDKPKNHDAIDDAFDLRATYALAATTMQNTQRRQDRHDSWNTRLDETRLQDTDTLLFLFF